MLFQAFKWLTYKYIKGNEHHKKTLALPQITVFDNSTEVSSGIIQREGDVSISFTQNNL
jgi:hypothetical protein